MHELQIFKSEEFGSVRTMVIGDEPYFVGKDVAGILGYKDTSDALKRHVDSDDKLSRCFTDSGQSREMYVINESGLYSLILSSKLPAAKRFKRWVTSEVLPAIRKHGVYAVDELLADPDTLIAALTQLKAEREKAKALTETVAVQKQQIAEMKPKASYYDVVLNCKDLVAISVIAKDYGWSANRMNRYLHGKGVQFKQGGIWLLYQKYAERGYTSTKTHSYPANDGTVHTKVHTYWTQQGRLFIYGLLKADAFCPRWNGRTDMMIDKKNSEGYMDPTTYHALTKIEKEEKAARRAACFRPLVYICSPFSGGIDGNTEKARRYSRFAVDKGTIPLTVHLLFPQFLSEKTERPLALYMGKVILAKCQEVWVFGSHISEGMAAEIVRAKKLGKAIRYFTEGLEEVKADA